jgi:hypothetical protein
MQQCMVQVKGIVNLIYDEVAKTSDRVTKKIQIISRDLRGMADTKVVKIWNADGVFKEGQDVDIPVLAKAWMVPGKDGKQGAFGLELNYFHRDGAPSPF